MTNKITKDNVTQKQQHSTIKDLDQLQALSEEELERVVGGLDELPQSLLPPAEGEAA